MGEKGGGTMRGAAVLLLALLTAIASLRTVPPTATTTSGVVMELPNHVGRWWGIDQDPTPAEIALLPPDTTLIRKEYDSAAGEALLCSIVLAGAEKRSIHRPEICLPAQGWTVLSGEVETIPLASGPPLRVMDLTLTRQEKGQTVLAHDCYWFIGDHVTTPYHGERIWRTSWDRIVHHISHRWAYVSVITLGDVPAVVALHDFIGQAAPQFMKGENP